MRGSCQPVVVPTEDMKMRRGGISSGERSARMASERTEAICESKDATDRLTAAEGVMVSTKEAVSQGRTTHNPNAKRCARHA